jgi:hypothetical protein
VPSAPGGGRHVTPSWALRSAGRRCSLTYSCSASYEISGALERSRALSVNLLIFLPN